jgi:hypothetical protein
VISYLDPDVSGIPGKILFYSTLGIFLSGLFGLFLLFVRRKTLGEEVVKQNVGLSLRQGILLSILVISLFILQSFRMLLWWDGLLVVAGIFLVELYFLSRN